MRRTYLSKDGNISIDCIFKLNMRRTYLKQCHLYLIHGLFVQTLLVQLHLITFALVEMLTVHAVAFDSGLPL